MRPAVPNTGHGPSAVLPDSGRSTIVGVARATSAGVGVGGSGEGGNGVAGPGEGVLVGTVWPTSDGSLAAQLTGPAISARAASANKATIAQDILVFVRIDSFPARPEYGEQV